MSRIEELKERSVYEPEFKAALREADDAELKEALRALEGEEGSSRKVGRLRAALRRRALRNSSR